MVGPRMSLPSLRPLLAGPALGALALVAILALVQRPAPLFVNLGAGDEAFARGFRAWERDGLRASGETMFRWTLDGARVDLPLRVMTGSLAARVRLARFTDRPAEIAVLSSGREVDRWTQPPRGWRERTVELGEVRGTPSLQFRFSTPDPEGLGVAVDWVEVRGAGRVAPSPRLLAGLLVLFLAAPLALAVLAGPAPSVALAAGAATLGAVLVAWDRLGGIIALAAAGPPAAVAAALLGLAFRLVARRWPDTVSGSGARALAAPAAALAVALVALSHPAYYYPDVDTHARFLAAARADPYQLFDPSEYQQRTGAWTREIAGRKVAFPYSPVFYLAAWPLAVVFGEVAAVKTAAVLAMALTLLLVHALARRLDQRPGASILAQVLAASLPALSTRLALALFPALLGQTLELLLIVHLVRRYPHLEGARDAAAACAFLFAAQAAYTGSVLNVSAVVMIFAGWEAAAGDRRKAWRLLGAWSVAAAAVVLAQYARFLPILWRDLLPHLGEGAAAEASAGLAPRVLGRVAFFYDLVYPLLLVPGLLALRGAAPPARRLLEATLLAGAALFVLRYAVPVLFRDAKEVELLAAPVAVTAAAALGWLAERGVAGRLAAVVATGIALAWGAHRAVAVYLDRFLAVGR
jgi:hypothetical protein